MNPPKNETALTGSVARHRPRWRVLVGIAALLASGFAGRAFAASLLVNTDQTTTQNISGTSGAPTIYSWDNFDRATTPLEGQTSPGGLVWKPQIGTWPLNGTTVRTNTSNADANVVMDLSTLDAAMVVTMTPVGTNARPGLTFNDDGSNNMLLLYSSAGGGTLTLSTYFGTTRVFLASTAGVGAPGTSFEVKVVSLGPTITVFVNGTLRLTQTLTGTNLCKFKDTGPGCTPDANANVGFGLWADKDTVSYFDDFRLESA
jgi:hypothetical protein